MFGARSLFIALLAALLLCSCDTWGRKVAYSLIPYVKTDASVSVDDARVNDVLRRMESVLGEVAAQHGLERLRTDPGLCYDVPDVEGEKLSRGSISIEREEREGKTKISLRLTQFCTVLPYGESIFDEVVKKLILEHGLDLTITREPAG